MSPSFVESTRLGPPPKLAQEVLQQATRIRQRLIDDIFDDVVAEMRIDVGGIKDAVLEDVYAGTFPIGPKEPQATVIAAITAQRTASSLGVPLATTTLFSAETFEQTGRLGPECALSDFQLKLPPLASSPLDLVRDDAVLAADRILGAHIVGNLMGVRQAREAVTQAWLKGDIECCDSDTSDLLYCYSKSGPRVPDGQWNQLVRRTVGFPSGTSTTGKVNTGFAPALDRFIQAATSCLCPDCDSSSNEWMAKSAFLPVTILALKENLTAHVPETARVQAVDVDLDVAEALNLLTAVADHALGECAEGPWALVEQFLPEKRNLGGLWLLRKALGTVLTWVASHDLGKPIDETVFLRDVAPAIWTVWAQSLPAASTPVAGPQQQQLRTAAVAPMRSSLTRVSRG